MPVKLSTVTTNNSVGLDFNKELGIKPINIKDKFIGVDTKSRDFQNLFGNNAVLKRIFNGGYSKEYSANFDAGPVSVGASTKVTLGKIYAKLGTVTTAQFDLGGVNLGVKKSGSANLESVAPETGNGITLRAKTLESFGTTPSLSLKLPTAELKLGLLGNIDVAAAAVDTRLSGSLGFRAFGRRRSVDGSTDLPRLSFPNRSPSANISSGKNGKPIELVNFSLAEVISGKPKPGSKPGTKGRAKLFDFEIKGVRLTSDLRNPFAAAKITPTISDTGSSIAISNRIPLITASMSLNKLASNGYAPLKLLAERIKRDSYDINYKLLDLSVGSDVKIGYTGKLGFSGYYSRAQFESGQTLNLSRSANQVSGGITVQNTTELKRLLDADGDGKATVRFNFGYSNVGLTLDFGLYANLFTQLEFGKLSVDVGTSIGFSNRFIDVSKRVGGRVVDFGPLYKGRL